MQCRTQARSSWSPAATRSCGAANAVLKRSAANANAPSAVPRCVHETLRSPGQPLDASTRAFMESRFGQDFSHVRVHADAHAADSARAVNAHAYTVGSDIAFGRAQYAPETRSGKALLAHELAHTAQHGQHKNATGARNLEVADPADSAEREAEQVGRSIVEGPSSTSQSGERIALRTSGRLLHRKLVVNPTDTVPLAAGASGTPQKLTAAVQGLINDTCPSGSFTVDATSGNVASKAEFCQWHPPLAPGNTLASLSPTAAGCGCLCDVVDDGQTTTVGFRAGGPGTDPGSVPGAGAGQGGVKTDPTVHIDPRFQGQYKISGTWVDVPFHLLFSHELCGHARPKMHGTHVARGPQPPGGTAPQEQPAVDAERAIAAEHNPPLPRRPDDYSGGARQKP
jgi:uncharacterized protein DUF4157